MDAATPLGIAMTLRCAAAAWLLWLVAVPCMGADNFALIVSGAAGGETYAKKYDGWSTSIVSSLKSSGYTEDHVIALSNATRDQIQRALQQLHQRLTKDDLLFVMLIGHGTTEGEVAKFNLVGPDMTARDWAEQLKPFVGRLVFVDTTSGSFPFLRQLSGQGRVVITATDSIAQEFETVFPEFFVKAFSDPAADADKDGRVSVFEAFSYASANVRSWFDRQNRLPTERALLDDDGDGVGREASNIAPDGAVAKLTYFQPGVAAAHDPLGTRQAELESAIADLKARRSTMPASAYGAELERLLTELARVSAQRPR
jgi:hypothetical protein